MKYMGVYFNHSRGKKMKRTVKNLIAALVITLTVAGTASAWECGSSSDFGFGIGVSPSKSTAAKIALRYCQMNTPMGYSCFIDYCY